MRRDSDMALFKYFSRVPTLPAKVPSLSEKELERTNADVKQALEGDNKGRGKYNEYTSVVTSFSLAWQFFPRRPCILVDVKSSNTAFDCQFMQRKIIDTSIDNERTAAGKWAGRFGYVRHDVISRKIKNRQIKIRQLESETNPPNLIPAKFNSRQIFRLYGMLYLDWPQNPLHCVAQ